MADVHTIEVNEKDLRIWQAAFNSALHQNITIDLGETYRKLLQQPASSALTKSLEGALAGVETYVQALKEAKEKDSESVS